MARCDWAIGCDYAFLDENRKMCMVGVFDRIFATAVPAVHHQASFVLKLIGEPKERVQFEKTIGITVARTPEKTPAGGEGTRR